jgi:hypothetical protein
MGSGDKGAVIQIRPQAARPLMRSKAEVERHHDMDRAGSLLPCADRRRSVVGLIIGSEQPKCLTQMELP